MRRRRFARPVRLDPVSRGGVMSYVICPNPACGDPVGGRIPQPPEESKLTCPHCKQTFSFHPAEVRSGLVGFNPTINRWEVHTLAKMLGI